MKYFVIFLILMGFVGSIFVIPPAFGICQLNPDWPERPCYAFPGAVSISTEQRWEQWSAYYDYKGGEWMEIKRIELLQAFANDSIEKWMNEDETFANDNVFHYYYYKGETPNLDGTFAYFLMLDKEIVFPCGTNAELVNGICEVIITESIEHWPVSSFTDGLFFIIVILPFFIPGALIFIVVSKTPRFSKSVILSVSISAIITILYFLSGLFLGWYPPVYA